MYKSHDGEMRKERRILQDRRTHMDRRPNKFLATIEGISRNYPISVLLVDDQPMIGEIVRRMLEPHADICFCFCADPADVFGIIDKIRPTVILQDLVMPGADGMDLLRQYRRRAESANIPVIVLSTKEDATVKCEAFTHEANDYLIKLPDAVELVARIRHHSKSYQLQLQRDEAMRALLEARKVAENASRAKSDFIASMSHELRTPLNAVIGFTELMLGDAEQPMTEHQQELVEHVNQAGWLLLDMINDILDLAKVEAGKLSIRQDAVDVRSLVDQCIMLNQANVAKYGISISSDITNDHMNVRADAVRLKQILVNLISNAIKYNRHGGKVTLSAEERPGDKLRIIVADTGMGIPQEKLGMLFEPFNRLGAESGEIEGHGIGLALTKRLVELMHVEIGVDSTVGKGTEFWVEFPHVTTAPKPVTGQTNEPAGFEQKMAAVAGKKVMYIEDYSINRLLMTKILAKYRGIELQCAETGEEGLEMLPVYKPDVLLLDMQLPGINGDGVLMKIKQDGLTLPVIAFSANAQQSDINEVMKLGAMDYITKPVDTKKLKLALLKAFGD